MTRFRKPCGWGKWDRTDQRPPLPEWLKKDQTGLTSSQKRSIEYWTTIHWATPPWMNDPELWDQMRKIYESANSSIEHVDHIMPLKGDGFCGLNVPWNLQVICKKENLRKSNRDFPGAPKTVEMFDDHVHEPVQMKLSV